jgi:hypothetical protein
LDSFLCFTGLGAGFGESFWVCLGEYLGEDVFELLGAGLAKRIFNLEPTRLFRDVFFFISLKAKIGTSDFLGLTLGLGLGLPGKKSFALLGVCTILGGNQVFVVGGGLIGFSELLRRDVFDTDEIDELDELDAGDIPDVSELSLDDIDDNVDKVELFPFDSGIWVRRGLNGGGRTVCT